MDLRDFFLMDWRCLGEGGENQWYIRNSEFYFPVKIIVIDWRSKFPHEKKKSYYILHITDYSSKHLYSIDTRLSSAFCVCWPVSWGELNGCVQKVWCSRITRKIGIDVNVDTILSQFVDTVADTVPSGDDASYIYYIHCLGRFGKVFWLRKVGNCFHIKGTTSQSSSY